MGNQIRKTEKKGYDLTIHLNDLKVSYDDVGEGNIPIIFLHGFPFDKSMWQLQLDFLKPYYRLITYDIRGFGKSTDESTSFTIDTLAKDLIDFMNALNIEKATICGLSMGGYIALNAISKYHNRFYALILCDTQCSADSPELREQRFATIKQIDQEGESKFNEAFINKVFHKDSIKKKKELVSLIRRVVYSNSKHIIIQGLRALAQRSETCTKLSRISIPTLIICGRQDEVTPLAQSEYLNTKIKDSILHVIEHAGHVSNIEQPIKFNQHLHEFLLSLINVNELIVKSIYVSNN